MQLIAVLGGDQSPHPLPDPKTPLPPSKSKGFDEPKLTSTGTLANAVFSSGATFLVTQPLYAIKTAEQLGVPIEKTRKSLYAGGVPNAFSGIISEIVAFYWQKQAVNYFNPKEGKLSISQDVAACSASAVMMSPLNAGFEQAMIVKQSSPHYRRLSYGSLCKKILGEHGWSNGIFRAVHTTAARDMIFNVGVFPFTRIAASVLYAADTNHMIYDWTKDLTASAIAGVVAAWMSTPLDLVNTRLQESVVRVQFEKPTATSIFKDIIKKEGVVGIFRGAKSRIVTIGSTIGLVAFMRLYWPKVFPADWHEKPKSEDELDAIRQNPRIKQ